MRSSPSITRGSPSRRIQVETDDALGIEDGDRGAGTGPDRQRARDLCRHGQAGPSCPARGDGQPGAGRHVDESETDAEGRFRINPAPADRCYSVTAYPPEGQPYLIATKASRLAQGRARAVPQPRLAARRLDPRQGHRGGLRQARPGGDRRVHHPRGRSRHRSWSIVRPIPQSDGSFQLGAEPSPGYLFITGPSDDYVLQAIGSRMVEEGQPGGRRIYSHAYAALDLKPGIDSQEVNLVLRRGATVTGRVVGPDGQPVRDAWIFSRLILDPSLGPGGAGPAATTASVRNGRFEIHGLAPDAEVPVYFLEPKRKLGAVVNLSGKSAAGGPVTVRLEPCGAARARLVDPDGKPVARPAAADAEHHDGRDPRSTRTATANDKDRPPLRRRGRPEPRSTRSTTRRSWSPMPTAGSRSPS